MRHGAVGMAALPQTLWKEVGYALGSLRGQNIGVHFVPRHMWERARDPVRHLAGDPECMVGAGTAWLLGSEVSLSLLPRLGCSLALQHFFPLSQEHLSQQGLVDLKSICVQFLWVLGAPLLAGPRIIPAHCSLPSHHASTATICPLVTLRGVS